MKKRRYRKGDILFRKGDPADEMFLIGKGRYRVLELGNELQPGGRATIERNPSNASKAAMC
jgi:CRP-like cAMP-binding protein